MSTPNSSAISSIWLVSSLLRIISWLILELNLPEDWKSQEERRELAFLNCFFSGHNTKPSGACVLSSCLHGDPCSGSVIPDEW